MTEKRKTEVLSDQGGAYIDSYEDVVPTLRAQTHGHEPCVAERTKIIEDQGGGDYQRV
ncbi:MAG: hypothetical protein LUD47_04065 [Clostridia bacterium]|nr:hypothetical protein [Clostridia bacterium]